MDNKALDRILHVQKNMEYEFCLRHTGANDANPTFYPEIPWTLMLEKCEFCEKSHFENVNFEESHILRM